MCLRVGNGVPLSVSLQIRVSTWWKGTIRRRLWWRRCVRSPAGKLSLLVMKYSSEPCDIPCKPEEQVPEDITSFGIIDHRLPSSDNRSTEYQPIPSCQNSNWKLHKEICSTLRSSSQTATCSWSISIWIMLASSTVLINGGDAYFLLVTIELGCWEKDEGFRFG